ncbi:sensor histidine kinase [Halosimplex pelagicum]|uniref:histidine kinase n=1 Tax=Halosimplex pelagicum TaxID=869886 RepID=A0A7D5TSB7_9EURY|nr:HAMP domain-containing sensor histidine kinase [Halosimplex pelagicum]QLH80414.1 GAF domain-containing protein [Halosimplex pelagicum]
MGRVSNEIGGGGLAVVGAALTVYHLEKLADSSAVVEVVHHLVPPTLSLGLVVLGVQLARGQLVDDRNSDRMLGWTVAGALALAAFDLWGMTGAALGGFPLRNPVAPLLAITTFGALGGALVGLYDAGRMEQKRSLELLNRINDTLRIATRELVHETDREELEQTVCDRLSDSDPYDAVWLGRYDPDRGRVRPVAWSGFDDEYVESLVVTVDDSPTGNGPGGRAIETREIQCVADVFDDPTMEPWWDQMERHGITSLAVVPIYHDDTVYGFFSIYTDRDDVFGERERAVLSELGETIGHAVASIEARERLAERERELAHQNERLDEFAGVVSHDLRNPLNVASGRVDLARGERDSEHLAVAADALDRMAALISDVLTLARQGETVDDFEGASLRALVEEAWETVDASDATLRIDGDLGRVACDPGRLRQLLENLFRNGVEHAGSDATVTVGPTADGFFVADDGPGIPPDRREEVFDAGFSTNEEGTGFGLNIVERIARAHGWDVSVGESADGGARFEFTGVRPPPSAVEDA